MFVRACACLCVSYPVIPGFSDDIQYQDCCLFINYHTITVVCLWLIGLFLVVVGNQVIKWSDGGECREVNEDGYLIKKKGWT